MKSAVYHESGHELKQEASELTKGRATQEKYDCFHVTPTKTADKANRQIRAINDGF